MHHDDEQPLMWLLASTNQSQKRDWLDAKINVAQLFRLRNASILGRMVAFQVGLSMAMVTKKASVKLPRAPRRRKIHRADDYDSYSVPFGM
jgi:hypothetical protein